MNEKSKGLWANIHAKRKRIKQGSGERMRSPGDKGAPTPDQMKKAMGEDAPTMNTGAIPDPKSTVQGPRKKKEKMPVLTRFKSYVANSS